MAARKPRVPPTTTPEPDAPDVSQIVVNVILLDEFRSPFDAPGGPFVFRNTAEGTAAQHLIAWAAQNFLDTPTVPEEPA